MLETRMQVSEAHSLWQTVIAALSLIGTIVVAVIVKRAANRIERLEYARGIRDTWATVDTVALQDDNILLMADALFHPTWSNRTVEQARKTWFAYLALNAHVSTFFGVDRGLLGGDYSRADHARAILPLLSDDEVFQITQSGAYEPAFSNWCKSVREQAARASG